jgi:UDP-N-acetylmuramate--L-alanine ligase
VFDDFADLVGDTLIVCLDDEHATALGERAAQRNIRVVGYGTKDHATIPNRAKVIDIAAERFGSRATFNVDGTIVQADVLVPGEHMVLNGAAALLAGHLAGGDVEKLAEGLSGFTGVRRRFEHRGTVNDIRVFDDYAHHPTEVEAVLRAARQKIEAEGRGRVVVVFQPHLYSRTAEFAEEFAAALSLADEAIVLDIFGAREQPVDGVTSRLITNAMTIPTTYVVDFSAAPAAVADIVQPGDIVLTMGAGNVTMLADEILNHVS